MPKTAGVFYALLNFKCESAGHNFANSHFFTFKGNDGQIVGEEKWQTCWCCQDQQKACRMARGSEEKLERTGPAEKERLASVPQREQLASIPEPPLPKKKEQSRLSRVPDREGGERVEVGESRTSVS